MADDTAGPIFLVKPDARLPPGALTVSSCLAEVAPAGWAIEWVTMTDADRFEAAARCGIGEDQLPSVIAWTTERSDTGFAWPHAFVDLDAAEWGLIANEADALRCAAFAGGPGVSTCADA